MRCHSLHDRRAGVPPSADSIGGNYTEIRVYFGQKFGVEIAFRSMVRDGQRDDLAEKLALVLENAPSSRLFLQRRVSRSQPGNSALALRVPGFENSVMSFRSNDAIGQWSRIQAH